MGSIIFYKSHPPHLTVFRLEEKDHSSKEVTEPIEKWYSAI